MSVRALYSKPRFENIVIAKVKQAEVYDDVLERLDGLEDYFSASELENNTIFRIETIKSIIDDPDDDTNETTKCRLESLYEEIKDAQMLMIIDG